MSKKSNNFLGKEEVGSSNLLAGSTSSRHTERYSLFFWPYPNTLFMIVKPLVLYLLFKALCLFTGIPLDLILNLSIYFSYFMCFVLPFCYLIEPTHTQDAVSFRILVFIYLFSTAYLFFFYLLFLIRNKTITFDCHMFF